MELADLPVGARVEDWTEISGCFSVCGFHIPSRSLVVVRDHFGKRPAFYAEADGMIIVASECKTLQALGVPLEVDPTVLREAYLYRWVLGEWHLFEACRQVPLGTMVTWSPEASFQNHGFWTPRFEPEAEKPGFFDEYCERTDRALRHTIRAAGQSYGRVGLLLSGGVDSSLLAALAREEVDSLDAYVGRIPGCRNREDERARKVADMLGIRLHVVDIDPSRFARDFPYMVRRIEELPRHTNNLVLCQLYEAAEGSVDVMLEGDGTGTFWGHSNSKQTFQFAEKTRKVEVIPRSFRQAAAGLLERIPGDMAWRIARVLAWDPLLYARTREAVCYSRPILDSLGLSLLNEDAWKSGEWDETLPLDDEIQAFMVRNLLRGSNIRHDRLSQPHGIAALSPFLSTDCWEVSRAMPREYRIMSGRTKPVLRSLLGRYLPMEVGQWKKMGFETPWPSWLRNELGPLRKEADSFLGATPFLPEGFWGVANRVGDPEAIWTALSLFALLREFGLLESCSRDSVCPPMASIS